MAKYKIVALQPHAQLNDDIRSSWTYLTSRTSVHIATVAMGASEDIFGSSAEQIIRALYTFFSKHMAKTPYFKDSNIGVLMVTWVESIRSSGFISGTFTTSVEVGAMLLMDELSKRVYMQIDSTGWKPENIFYAKCHVLAILDELRLLLREYIQRQTQIQAPIPATGWDGGWGHRLTDLALFVVSPASALTKFVVAHGMAFLADSIGPKPVLESDSIMTVNPKVKHEAKRKSAIPKERYTYVNGKEGDFIVFSGGQFHQGYLVEKGQKKYVASVEKPSVVGLPIVWEQVFSDFCLATKAKFPVVESQPFLLPDQCRGLAQICDVDGDDCLDLSSVNITPYMPHSLAEVFNWIRADLESISPDQYPKLLQIAVSVYGQMIAQLKDIHDLGYFHLDLKPDNVYFDDDFRMKLGDQSSIMPSKPSPLKFLLNPTQVARLPEAQRKRLGNVIDHTNAGVEEYIRLHDTLFSGVFLPFFNKYFAAYGQGNDPVYDALHFTIQLVHKKFNSFEDLFKLHEKGMWIISSKMKSVMGEASPSEVRAYLKQAFWRHGTKTER